MKSIDASAVSRSIALALDKGSARVGSYVNTSAPPLQFHLHDMIEWMEIIPATAATVRGATPEMEVLMFSDSIRERFERHIERVASGCWEWQTSLSSGYGVFNINQRIHVAHRVAWMLYRGDIPDGLCVLHRCDNRRCVNPDHLFLGTRADNTADMLMKGREARGSRMPNAILTADDIPTIRQLWESGMKSAEIAALFGVARQTINS